MEEINLTCPYCLQAISMLIDRGYEGHNEFIEDCEVCCRPIDIEVMVEDSEVLSFSYNAVEGNEF